MPKRLQGVVDLRGRRSFEQHELVLAPVGVKHAIADEAEAVAHHHTGLADALGHRLRRRHDVGCRGATAHDLDQAHDVRGAEEVHADDRLRPAHRRCDAIHVQGGRVGREDGVGAANTIELPEDLALDVHILEHGLDDQVRAREPHRGRTGCAAVLSRPVLPAR